MLTSGQCGKYSLKEGLSKCLFKITSTHSSYSLCTKEFNEWMALKNTSHTNWKIGIHFPICLPQKDSNATGLSVLQISWSHVKGWYPVD